MIYYFSFAVLTTINLFLGEVFRLRFFLYVVLVLAFLFSALRYNAGYDYFSYFKLIAEGEGVAFDRLELFNKYLMRWSRGIGCPQVYYAVTSFIYMCFMALGFRRVGRLDSTTLVVFLFFVGLYLNSFDIIRQMVAVSLVFYATTRLLDRDYLPSFSFALIAYGFHRSAIIFVLICFFCVLFSRRKYGFLLYALASVVAFFSLDVVIKALSFTGLYVGYVKSGGNETGGKIYLILCFMLALLYLVAKTKEQSGFFWVSFNLFFLGFLIYTVFLPLGYFATRVSYFLFPWAAIAWSELVSNSEKNKMLLMFLAYSFSLAVFFLVLYVSSLSERNPYLDYSFYFFR